MTPFSPKTFCDEVVHHIKQSDFFASSTSRDTIMIATNIGEFYVYVNNKYPCLYKPLSKIEYEGLLNKCLPIEWSTEKGEDNSFALTCRRHISAYTAVETAYSIMRALAIILKYLEEDK